jgi:hypothetical protein
MAGGAIEAAAQEIEQALVGDPAELFQELAVVPEVESIQRRIPCGDEGLTR